MTRAAIYARYSSDQQSAASIPDQVRLCRRLCQDNGWTVVEAFVDEAMSGATHLRPDFQRMQQLAMTGGFDVLVAEGLDRLSRDQEHIAGLHKRLTYLGVKIVTKAEGEVNELHIGLGGTMSALFLRQLAQKTHRGLEGRVRQGKAAGGLSYGYRNDRRLTESGDFTTGDRLIHQEEAETVQRIFRDYAAGKSARSIAMALNAEGIRGPRGEVWNFSTISGNWKRGTGILNNELYIGKLVWNRQRFVKDPSTGKRQARPNPPDAWITEDVPHLRVIDDALWQTVKVRQGAIREVILTTDRTNAFGTARRPTYLFSGLLNCGCCGANYILIGKDRYGCAATRNRGTCTNRSTIKRDELESRVLDGLRDHLLHPDLVAEFVSEYQRAHNETRIKTLAARGRTERELATLAKQIEDIVDAVCNGMYHPSMKDRLTALEERKAALTRTLSEEAAEEPIALHPGLADIYRQRVAELRSALNAEESRAEATTLLRGLLLEIRMIPTSEGHVIELVGELGAILALGDAQNTKPRLVAGAGSSSMVAGAGFEPAAFRL